MEPNPQHDAEVFSADAQVLPNTANATDGTIDVVWYSGAAVPRIDRATGEPYMLQLDMQGCRFDRLNNGAPVFDTHFTGDDFKSLIAGKVGTRAQVGVVRRAWPNGEKGMATLQFDLGDPDGAEMFRKASSGILQNLSFGTWVYKREKAEAETEGIDLLKATDWEPFEISPCTIPADFNTCFLSAQPNGEVSIFSIPESPRATSPHKEKPAMEPSTTPQATGEEARTNEQALDAARQEATQAERQRVSDIQALSLTAIRYGIDGTVISKFIAKGVSVDQARKELFAQLEQKGSRDMHDQPFKPVGEHATITRDVQEQRFACMQMALLLRSDPHFFLARHKKTNGEQGEYLDGNGPERQKQALEMAREYRNFRLIDMARESLELRAIHTRGMDVSRVTKLAMEAPSRGAEFFIGGAEATADFPAILANVANKTLRQAYEAYPRTFQPFCRQVTALDFKPINRVQLSDVPALQQLNEKGEYHRAQLTDMNTNYSLQTFGEVVALTRKVIINDDLQAFTRVPSILGVAAAQLESNTVWGLITANGVMTLDGKEIFCAAHKNLLSGAASSIDPTVKDAAPLTALAKARVQMRLQKAPQGSPLDLIPRYLAVPPSLETYALQLVYPINIASSDQTKVVPEWVRSLVPVVEPRLDNATGTAANWFLFTDPATIDTLEYCYLEGQQGVYIETKQGFEVDGIEIKARMDFGAAAVDYRGLQKNAGQ